MRPRVNEPLKPEALRTDLSNLFSHSFGPSAFIGRLLYTGPALGLGIWRQTSQVPTLLELTYFRGRNCRGRKGLSPPSYPSPAPCLGSLHHRRCLTYLPPLPDPARLEQGGQVTGEGLPSRQSREGDVTAAGWVFFPEPPAGAPPSCPQQSPRGRKGAGEPSPLVPEESGRAILVVQARLEPPQEPASVLRSSEHPGGSWASLPAQPAQQQPAQEEGRRR